MAAWSEEFDGSKKGHDVFTTPEATTRPTVQPNDRISIYWTELDQWYSATHTSTRQVHTDDGLIAYDSRVVYDAVGPWQKPEDLIYYHDLNKETWELE